MKKLLVLVLAMTIASSALAVVDPDPNSLGFYMDLTADMVEVQDAAPNSTHMVYCILTNPTFDNLFGIEYGYDATAGSAFVLGTTFANPQALDVGSAGNHIVGFGAPTPTTEATLISTMTVLFLGPVWEVTLTGTEPSSLDPALPTLLLPNSVLQSSGDSTDIGNVNFSIMGVTPVATETVTFDSVKSLYR
jgi:hypothetical protein